MQHTLPRGTLFLLSVSVLVALATEGSTRQEPDVRVVQVVAERFSFRPSEIALQQGETLVLELRSEDTTHGFRILGTDVDVRVPRRGRGRVTVAFTPEQPGRYRFECSKLCGAGHNFMRGELVVRDPSARDPAGEARR